VETQPLRGNSNLEKGVQMLGSMRMKAAITFFVVATMLIAPIACAVVVCPELETHDCCPKAKTFAACPFDILAAAKATVSVAVIAIANVPVVHDPEIADVFVAPFEEVADDRDPQLFSRVLRL
jgi:hypothetical protein